MDYRATKPHRNWGPTVKALGVMVLDPKIRAFLEREDPKALEQAIRALEEEGFAPGRGTLREPDDRDPNNIWFTKDGRLDPDGRMLGPLPELSAEAKEALTEALVKPDCRLPSVSNKVLQELHDRGLVEPIRAGVWVARETMCKVALKPRG